MDLINPNKPFTGPQGFRKRLARHGVKGLRAQAMLPKNSQEEIDAAVTRIGRQRLIVANRLIEAGLTRPIRGWFGITKLTREAISESGHAKLTMVPKARGERQAADREAYSIPVPCMWDDYSFNIREIEAADRSGEDLGTIQVEQATRNVNELTEQVVIYGWKDANGEPIKIDGMELPGLLDSTTIVPNTANRSFAHSSHTGQDILNDFQARAEALRLSGYPGPYDWFLPANYNVKLNQDFKAESDKSILARIRELEYGGRAVNPIFADELPDDTDLLVQMTNDVVELRIGQTPVPVTWSDGPGWEEFGVVLACVVLQVFPNYNGDYGVAVGQPSL